MNVQKLLSIAAVGALTAFMSGSALAGADSNIISGPVTFSPGARIKLDCPRDPNAPPALSGVQGFGHLDYPVKFKLQYSPYSGQQKTDIYGTEQITKDYSVSLYDFLGNFPGPGYYALVMRNTNPFTVTVPNFQQLGISCQ